MSQRSTCVWKVLLVTLLASAIAAQASAAPPVVYVRRGETELAESKVQIELGTLKAPYLDQHLDIAIVRVDDKIKSVHARIRIEIVHRSCIWDGQNPPGQQIDVVWI